MVWVKLLSNDPPRRSLDTVKTVKPSKVLQHTKQFALIDSVETGCTLSSAIAAALAQVMKLAEAVTEAKVYLEKHYFNQLPLGKVPDALALR